MKRPVLNRSRDFAEVWCGGDPDAAREMRGARYLQGGNAFDHNGTWIPPEGLDLSTIEDQPEEAAATPVADRSAKFDEFVARLYEMPEIEQLPWVTPTDEDGERPQTLH